MTKKIIIVGGGITGCISALYAKKKGFDVEIHERYNQLGGILNDDFGDDFFISGCQYINIKSKWFELIEDLKIQFTSFKVKYGSYTKFKNQKEVYTDFFPGPACELYNIPTDQLVKKNVYGTLSSRIKCYDKEVETNITHWLKKNVVDFQKLNYLSTIPLGIKRLSTNKNIKRLLKKKKENLYVNELYGLPRKIMKYDDLYQALPTRGFTNFFLNLQKILIKVGIKVHTKSTIKIKKNENSFDIYNFNNKLNFDYVIWAATPTPVIAILEKKILDTKPLLITNYCFEYKGKLPNFYLQVFDDKIFRLNCFSVKNNPHIVVECFDDNLEIKKMIEDIVRLLKNFKINLIKRNIKFSSKFLKKRYLVISNNDYKIIQKFKKKKLNKFLPGCWDVYSRDEKINGIIDQINKLPIK